MISDIPAGDGKLGNLFLRCTGTYVPDLTFLWTVPPGADSLHVQVQVNTHTGVVPGNSRGPGGKGGGDFNFDEKCH